MRCSNTSCAGEILHRQRAAVLRLGGRTAQIGQLTWDRSRTESHLTWLPPQVGPWALATYFETGQMTIDEELGALMDATLVPQAIAAALGIREQAGRPLAQSLLDDLQSKEMLLANIFSQNASEASVRARMRFRLSEKSVRSDGAIVGAHT